MASKAELISRLEELVGHEDVESASESVEGVKEAYEALVAAASQQAQSEHVEPVTETATIATDEASSTNGATPAPVAEPVPIESAQLLDEEDKRFKQLLDAFNQRVNDIRRKKIKEETDNLSAKKAIMEELKALIASEENIGTAFQRGIL